MNNPVRYRIIVIGLLAVVLLAAACGSREQVVDTPVPTPSGPPTPIPPGAEGNPIRIVILPATSLTGEERADSGTELSAAVKEKTGLAVEVVTVNRYAEALAALCDSGSGQVSISWLDGVTYVAAMAQNCGTPSLQVKRDTHREVETGASGQIILSRELGSTDVNSIRGRTFCRLGYNDFYSWLLPVLALKTQGIDLLSAPDQIVDYEDVPALVKAVAAGECAAAGIAEDSFDVYADELGEDVREGVRFALTTIPFPFPVLMYPIEVQLGVRLALNDALVDIANTPDTAATMAKLLDQESLVHVEPKDFAELVDFMNSTGYDFAQLGS